MNEANYGKCRDLSAIWEFSKNWSQIITCFTSSLINNH